MSDALAGGVQTMSLFGEMGQNIVEGSFADAMPGPRRYQSTTTARCAKELTDLPVVTSNDAYRLGNAVERQGVDWLGARRHVLQHPKTFEDSILYNFLMGKIKKHLN